uniref:ZP domain-containing protein n=1 Tax=Labrus bergylta TaxID=56723 RepID=A0A3Q3F322_9LABR
MIFHIKWSQILCEEKLSSLLWILLFKLKSFYFTIVVLCTGTLVSSCDSCHDEAACHESKERGDTFSNQTLSCLCNDGFVGDGLMCYSIKLCSDSSCCKEGYQWSPDRGCVDTDECSLTDSPCKPSQVCTNTPGSFVCLEPSPSSRSGPSSQSVQFSCGSTVCPSGTDCVRMNGTLQCADPCQEYTVLNDDWRSTNNTSTQNLHCDQHVDWQGWYRLFLGQTSAQIPERCVAENSCGTHAPLWITTPHPTQSGQIVSRTVCGSWLGSCCFFSSHTIHVKLCYGNYFVYKLVRPISCSLAYCLLPPVGKFFLPLFGNAFNAATHNTSTKVYMSMYFPLIQSTPVFQTNRTHTIYSNSLFVYPVINGSFNLPVSIPFSCAYPLETDTSLNVAIRPFLSSGGILGSGAGPSAVMSLFRNSAFTETFPAGGVNLPLGSPLYVGVSVTERELRFVVVLEECYASHSPDPHYYQRYSLIQNKCSTDAQQVSVIESGMSLRARFSALLFLLEDDYRAIYLHCNISLCDRERFHCVPVSQTVHFINELFIHNHCCLKKWTVTISALSVSSPP